MIELSVYLLAFTTSVLSAAGVLLLARWPSRPRRLVTLLLFFGSLLASLLAARAGESLAPARSGARLFVWLAVISLAALLIHFQLRWARHLVRNQGLASRSLVALLGMQLLLATFTGWRLYSFGLPAPDRFKIRYTEQPRDMKRSAGRALLTDRGHRVPVYEAEPHSREPDDFPDESLERHAIRQAAPDSTVNGHGWVFTSGNCVILGRDVDTILADNGYEIIEQPQPGDLIVYRDEEGQIVHSGLVRAVLDDGEVLVESKWGAGGRFLHRAPDQGYSPYFFYYHTTRSTHIIPVVEDGV